MQSLQKADGGFSLVELMVVVLIIGVLVTIAVPVFTGAAANAKAKSCEANQRTIEGAIQTFNASLMAGQSQIAAADVLDGTDASGVNQLIGAAVHAVPKCSGAGGSTYSVDSNQTVDGDKGGSSWTTDGLVHAHY